MKYILLFALTLMSFSSVAQDRSYIAFCLTSEHTVFLVKPETRNKLLMDPTWKSKISDLDIVLDKYNEPKCSTFRAVVGETFYGYVFRSSHGIISYGLSTNSQREYMLKTAKPHGNTMLFDKLLTGNFTPASN